MNFLAWNWRKRWMQVNSRETRSRCPGKRFQHLSISPQLLSLLKLHPSPSPSLLSLTPNHYPTMVQPGENMSRFPRNFKTIQVGCLCWLKISISNSPFLQSSFISSNLWDSPSSGCPFNVSSLNGIIRSRSSYLGYHSKEDFRRTLPRSLDIERQWNQNGLFGSLDHFSNRFLFLWFRNASRL